MAHVHWWLIILSFLLGLVLTCALMVRSTKYQVAAAASGAGADAADAETKPPAMKTATATRKEGCRRRGRAQEEGSRREEEDRRREKGRRAQDCWGQEAPSEAHGGGQAGSEEKGCAGQEGTDRKDRCYRGVLGCPAGAGAVCPVRPGFGPSRCRRHWVVKGRTDTRHYYTPEDSSYETTCAQVWFQDEAAAARAFFTAWSKSTHRK
ncbi:channel accessory protein ArfC, sunset domain variant [Mycobacterium marinum]|uniref:channel accessory protein ArfC, sunset domain variant n=1 Tax=Mycobacterium marinum TaxID=1781 RepID=UPI003FEFF65D